MDPAEGGASPRWTLVYAPGAGSSLTDPFGAALAERLPRHGIATLRFQFPYAEAGRRLPDRPPILEATWRAAIARARAVGGRLAIGGRSMGGRIASQVATEGEVVDALTLFAYPLHPPGKPEQLRSAHLGRISAPLLFCSGTNDAFASPDELRSLIATLPGGRLHLLDGADHGFSVPKRTGRTRPDVWAEALEATLAFLGSL